MLEDMIDEDVENFILGIVALAAAAVIAYGAYTAYNYVFKDSECCQQAKCGGGYYCKDLPKNDCECRIDIPF